MPQIPKTEISNLPDTQVERAVTPDWQAAAAPTEDLAKTATEVGNTLGEWQQRQQAAQNKKDATLDEINATKASIDYRAKLTNLRGQVLAQNKETPENIVPAFQQGLQQIGDGWANAAPTANEALLRQKDGAKIAAEESATTGNIAEKYKTDRAQDQLYQGTLSGVQSVAQAPSSQVFAHWLQRANESLDVLRKYTTSEPNKDRDAFNKKSANEWVNQNTLPNKNAMLVRDALLDDNNPVSKLLTGAERQEGIKKAQAAFVGAGQQAQLDMLWRSQSGIKDLTSLLSANDPQMARVASALRNEASSHLDLLAQQPIPQADKDKIKQFSQQVISTIDNAEKVYRQSTGSFSLGKEDLKVFEQLHTRASALFAKHGVPPGDMLGEMLKLRDDNMSAVAVGKISKEDWQVTDDKITNAFGAMFAKSSADGGAGWFHHQTAVQAGNQLVDDVLAPNGRYGNANQKQRNEIWARYMFAANSAVKNGGRFTPDLAKQAALNAANTVMGQKFGQQ